jgi:hypothetical protein
VARQFYLCTVTEATVAVGVPGTTDPVIQVVLTDANGSFSGAPFFASENGKLQMLDVALAAITAQKQVNATLDNPSEPVTPPGAQIYRLSIIA